MCRRAVSPETDETRWMCRGYVNGRCVMKEIAGKKVILTEGEFLRLEDANKRYLMKLETPYLLRSY